MPRFSLKDLFRGFTLIAAGTMLMFAPLYLFYFGPAAIILAYLAWLWSGATIDAALFTPFGKPWLGASLGMMVQFLYLTTGKNGLPSAAACSLHHFRRLRIADHRHAPKAAAKSIAEPLQHHSLSRH